MIDRIDIYILVLYAILKRYIQLIQLFLMILILVNPYVLYTYSLC